MLGVYVMAHMNGLTRNRVPIGQEVPFDESVEQERSLDGEKMLSEGDAPSPKASRQTILGVGRYSGSMLCFTVVADLNAGQSK